MSRRTIILNALGLAGCVALAWGIRGLMLTGDCGGEGAPPCPPESVPLFIAVTIGLAAPILAAVAGGKLAAAGLFPAVGIGAIWAGLELPPGQRSTPLVIGVVFLAVLLAPLLLLPFAIRKRRRQLRIVEEGVAGIGIVTDIRDTGVTINRNPRVELTVRIEPQNGAAPFAATKTFTMPRVEIPQRGHRFPVWYDTAAPDDFVYGVRLTPDASPEVRRLFALAEARKAEASALDPLDRLAKLHELRLAGALTEAEYEAQKAKLLSAD